MVSKFYIIFGVVLMMLVIVGYGITLKNYTRDYYEKQRMISGNRLGIIGNPPKEAMEDYIQQTLAYKQSNMSEPWIFVDESTGPANFSWGVSYDIVIDVRNEEELLEVLQNEKRK